MNRRAMIHRGLTFQSEAAQRARMPVVLLSGFLGSGKTTLVNAMLRDERLAGTAVAVNEFGEVPLDQHLIDHGGDRTVVMANGCLCCNLAGDLEEAVMRVFSRRQSGELPAFERLIIEPSGLADPAPIAQAILRNPVLSRVLRLDAILSVVDAVFIGAQLVRHPETRKQVALADRLVLTKTDLVDGEALERVRGAVRRFNPVAPIVVAMQGRADPTSLFPAEFLTTETLGVTYRSALHAELVEAEGTAGHWEGTVAVSLLADAPLQWGGFDAWLRGIRIGHSEQLLRVKGMLNVKGVAGPVVIQGVHHVVHSPVELDGWPDGDRRSRIVFITQGVPDGFIRASWDAALPSFSTSEFSTSEFSTSN